MEKVEQHEFKFDPELNLQSEEIAALVGIYNQPGFKVLVKILRTSVDWFVSNLINADPASSNKVLAAQSQAKTASQLYTLWLSTVNEEVYQYLGAQPTTKAVEVAQGLDLGETYTDEEPVI